MVFLPLYLEEVVLGVILNQVGVDPALPVGQAVSGDVQGVLRGLDGQLEAPDLRLQQLILAWKWKMQSRCRYYAWAAFQKKFKSFHKKDEGQNDGTGGYKA